ncbi:MAG: BON domain-containing protein, partial [Terriglobales bacterium]
MKTKFSLCLSTITLVTILIAGVACSKAPSDSQMATDIQNKISADSGLQGKQLVVQAANGTVTLSGTVDNDAERDAAAKYASSEAGVKQVVNNLTVASAPPVEAEQQAPAPATIPPAEESRKEEAASRRHHRHSARSEESAQNSDNSNNNMPMASNSAPPPMNNPENAAPAPPPPQLPPPPPPPQKVTIPSGTSLSVRLIDPIDSEAAHDGDTFHATLNAPLSVDGDVAVPAGYEALG